MQRDDARQAPGHHWLPVLRARTGGAFRFFPDSGAVDQGVGLNPLRARHGCKKSTPSARDGSRADGLLLTSVGRRRLARLLFRLHEGPALHVLILLGVLVELRSEERRV